MEKREGQPTAVECVRPSHPPKEGMGGRISRYLTSRKPEVRGVSNPEAVLGPLPPKGASGPAGVMDPLAKPRNALITLF